MLPGLFLLRLGLSSLVWGVCALGKVEQGISFILCSMLFPVLVHALLRVHLSLLPDHELFVETIVNTFVERSMCCSLFYLWILARTWTAGE
jgi:hypothetical protein